MRHAQFSELIGKVITQIRGVQGDDHIVFVCADGTQYDMFHESDCCESVRLYDVCGELEDIRNTTVLMAEESTSGEHPSDFVDNSKWGIDSFTWTFYRVSTLKGSVVLRWLGESNGYYSESVSFYCTSEPELDNIALTSDLVF